MYRKYTICQIYSIIWTKFNKYHISVFFDMKRESSGSRSDLALSVLSGLVEVSHNKTRNAKGQLTGPTTVKLFGFPIYVGRDTKDDKE